MTMTIDQALKLADQDCPLPVLAGQALKLLRDRVRELEAAQTVKAPEDGLAERIRRRLPIIRARTGVSLFDAGTEGACEKIEAMLVAADGQG